MARERVFTPEEALARKRLRGILYGRNRRIRARARGGGVAAVEISRPPAHVLAEREHRLSLAPGSLTEALLGDPPRGYSALDRR